MKVKYCILILLVSLFLCNNFAFAHNTQQSSFKFFLSDNDSFIEIILSQYGIEQALVKKYPDLNLKLIKAKDFKEILVQHLKQNISISENGKPLNIGSGLIKMGSHQTNVKFKVDNIKDSPEFLDIKASCFQENEKQNNIFTVEYNGLSARAKLNKENMFQAKYIFNESSIEVMRFQVVN